MNNILAIVSIILVILVGFLSMSTASVAMMVLTILVSFIFTRILGDNIKEYNLLTTAFLFSFIFVTFLATMQWLSIEHDMSMFANDDNDHYKFFIASQDGSNAPSIRSIFNTCILSGIYWENGGYYFLIQLIAYVANNFFDGNCILLQQLGTTAFFVWSSIFFSKTLMLFCPRERVRYYTIFYIIVCPLVLHSLGIHRDVQIAFLYMVLIYITLSKNANIIMICIQLLIAVFLFFLREQHGLFSILFVGMSLLLSRGKSKFVLLIIALIFFAILGLSEFTNFIGSNLADTNEYYDAYRHAALSGLDSGIGRYVYMLPTPLKELAQIIVLQMRFPPWGAIEMANNPYALIIGIEGLFVASLWFYVFVSLFAYLVKYKFSRLPKQLNYGLVLLFVFLLLNTSNLESRRVVCMYPFMFIPYVYIKNVIAKKSFTKRINKMYFSLYILLTFAYLLLKLLLG